MLRFKPLNVSFYELKKIIHLVFIDGDDYKLSDREKLIIDSNEKIIYFSTNRKSWNVTFGSLNLYLFKILVLTIIIKLDGGWGVVIIEPVVSFVTAKLEEHSIVKNGFSALTLSFQFEKSSPYDCNFRGFMVSRTIKSKVMIVNCL